ncbi:MAG: hypothetical protein ABIA74_04320 [bacterium]
MKIIKIIFSSMLLFAITTSVYTKRSKTYMKEEPKKTPATSTIEIKETMSTATKIQDTSKPIQALPIQAFKSKEGISYDPEYAKKVLTLESGMQNIETMRKEIQTLKSTLLQIQKEAAQPTQTQTDNSQKTILDLEKQIKEKEDALLKAFETLIKETGLPETLVSIQIGMYGFRTQPWDKIKTEKNLDEIKIEEINDLIQAFKNFIQQNKNKLQKAETNLLLAHLRLITLNPGITKEQIEELKIKLKEALDEKDFAKQKEKFINLLKNNNYFSEKMRDDVIKDIEIFNFPASINSLNQAINNLLRQKK